MIWSNRIEVDVFLPLSLTQIWDNPDPEPTTVTNDHHQYAVRSFSLCARNA